MTLFQFHKGTIKTRRRAYIKNPDPHFNSIKVRLKLDVLLAHPMSTALFQFHKGTIKTIDINPQVNQNLAFQFHKGTIKTTRVS